MSAAEQDAIRQKVLDNLTGKTILDGYQKLYAACERAGIPVTFEDLTRRMTIEEWATACFGTRDLMPELDPKVGGATSKLAIIDCYHEPARRIVKGMSTDRPGGIIITRTRTQCLECDLIIDEPGLWQPPTVLSPRGPDSPA